jgi:hypothetical protein
MLIAKKTNLTMAYSSSLSKTATFMFRAIIICVLMAMASFADAYPIPGNAGASIDQKNNATIINQILPPDLIPGNITVITNHVVVSLLGTVRGSLAGATNTEIIIMLCSGIGDSLL